MPRPGRFDLCNVHALGAKGSPTHPFAPYKGGDSVGRAWSDLEDLLAGWIAEPYGAALPETSPLPSIWPLRHWPVYVQPSGRRKVPWPCITPSAHSPS